jgi:hypothetical protein
MVIHLKLNSNFKSHVKFREIRILHIALLIKNIKVISVFKNVKKETFSFFEIVF